MSWKHEYLLREPPSLRAHIEFLLSNRPQGWIIEAVKFYRQEVPGAGLKQARDRVVEMKKNYLGVS